jgi:hypothetical protein
LGFDIYYLLLKRQKLVSGVEGSVAALLFIILCALGAPARAQEPIVRIGEIEFFGVQGFALNTIRAALPVAEGQEIRPDDAARIKTDIAASIKQIIGRAATDVEFVCCDDHGAAMIYIGLASTAAANFRYRPTPASSAQLETIARLTDDAVRLYEEETKLNVEALQTQAAEEHAKGYALSLYPPLRARQLALREYALKHEGLLRRVLLQSTDAKQRAMAAYILGYARQSSGQITALVNASRDASEGVRNNAMRALGVLAQSSATIARSIPADTFIGMLSSGIWTDRNKASFLLSIMSANRDPRLLRQLRARALPALIEMARWRDHGHADNSRLILGRLGGIEEGELLKLVVENKTDEIIRRLSR